ncbi:HNH endonuclease [Acidovorax citrulli]|nr:HNH endonuclease [Paracidovorax citrulli]
MRQDHQGAGRRPGHCPRVAGAHGADRGADRPPAAGSARHRPRPRGAGQRRRPGARRVPGVGGGVNWEQEYRCVSCGGFKDLTCDHIHPESKGGPTTLDNLQTMCRPCNSKKGVRA